MDNDKIREVAVLLLYIAETLQDLNNPAAAEALAHIDAAAGQIADLIEERPKRRRGHRLRRIPRREQQPEAPKTAVPARRAEPVQLAVPVDGKDQYDKLLAECKKRGYDPDLMLGLARALPGIEFVKSSHGEPLPVWRGKNKRG